MIRRPKTWEVEPRQVRKLLDAHDSRTVRGKRDRAILTVLAFTAIRRAELCDLTVGDFDPDKLKLGVQTLKQRGKGKRRTLDLNPEVVSAIRSYLRTRENGQPLNADGPLFLTLGRHGPWRVRGLTPARINHIVKRTLERAGIIDSHVTPHSFRHNLATQWIRDGQDLATVRDFLGHRQISSTDKYLHSHPSRLKEAAQSVVIAARGRGGGL